MDDGGTGRLTRFTVGTKRRTPAVASALTVVVDVDIVVISGSLLPTLPVEETEVDGVQCTVEEFNLPATVA